MNITASLLTELLIKSVVILVAAGLLNAALSRISAAKRHYIWAGAFVALLLLPLTKLVSPLWPIELNKPRPMVIVEPPPLPGLEPVRSSFTAPTPIALVPTPAQSTNWQRVAISVWIAGAVLMFTYQLLGRLRLAWLERRSVANNDARLEGLLSAAAEEASIRRSITLRISGEARVPITWGAFRPVVLLPVDWTDWSEAKLLAVLRHELAHIARNDYLVRQFTQLVAVLYWPNPLVWLAASALRSAQEQACDDRVLRQGTAPTDYATLLFESVRALSQNDATSRHALAMARPSTLERRVVAIVDDSRDRRSGGAVALLGAMLFTTGILTLSALAQVAGKTPTTPANSLNQSGAIPPGVEVSIQQKAEALMIPKLDLRGASLRECLDFLRRRSIELDPQKQGFSFVLKLPNDHPGVKTPITLSLQNVSFAHALKYISSLANCRTRYEQHAIAIVEAGNTSLIYKEYQLPANLRDDMTTLLKRHGVTFPEGATAVYIVVNGRLIVRNTEDNLDRVEDVVRTLTKNGKLPPTPASSNAAEAKLQRIIIPRLEFRETTPQESIQFLENKIRELDPAKTGVKLEMVGASGSDEPKITISLSQIPASEALKYITNLANRTYRFTADNRVLIEPLSKTLIIKQYRVPANSISTKAGTVKGPDGVTYASANEFFTAFGVTFPEGASAGLPIDGDIIAMRNTQLNLDITDVIVTALTKAAGGKLSDDEVKDLRTRIWQMKSSPR